MMRFMIVAILLGLAPMPALAHKVIAAVYPSGKAIEGEIGFSDGMMAADQRVTVTAPDGQPLGDAMTDAEGMFTFTPTEPIEHVFNANLGAGHVAQTSLSAQDVAKILGKAVAPVTASTQAVQGGGAVALDQEAVAAMLRDELRPLRQEISAYKEKNDFQTILGGFGYIAGIFGLGFYLAARRKLAAVA